MNLKEVKLIGLEAIGDSYSTIRTGDTDNGHSYFVNISLFSASPQYIIYSFGETINYRKFHWEGWIDFGWYNDPEADWVKLLYGGGGDNYAKFWVIPEGQIDNKDNWVCVWLFSDNFASVTGSGFEYYGATPNEIRYHENLSVSLVHPTVVRATHFAVEISNPNPTFETAEVGELVKQIDLRVWKDDTDYFEGWAIALTGTDDGSLDVSGGNTYDGDFDTSDSIDCGIGEQDAIWSLGGTKSLSRVVCCVKGEATNPVDGCWGGGGYFKAYYKDPSSAWHEIFLMDYSTTPYNAYDANNLPLNAGAMINHKTWYDFRVVDGDGNPVNADATHIKLVCGLGEGGGDGYVYEIMAFSGEAKAMEIYSKTGEYTATTDPTEIRAVLIGKALEAITINTDLILSVSRDGGTTWTAVTLAKETAPYNSSLDIYTGSADVSGQPSGTDIMWKVVTTAKKIRVDGVSLTWG